MVELTRGAYRAYIHGKVGVITLLPPGQSQTCTPLGSLWGLISSSTAPRQLWVRARGTGVCWRAGTGTGDVLGNGWT